MNDKKAEHARFESVVMNSSRYIYSLSYRLTGSSDDAKDLMQETYLKAFQKWDTVKNKNNAIPWLRKICLNAFIDTTRKSYSKQKMNEIVFPSNDHDIISNSPSPEQELLASEEVQKIKSQCYTILSTSLNMYQRISFVLVDIFQMNIREVSRMIHKSVASTKSLLYRARKRMTATLGATCSLVDIENYCRCESWKAFSHDIKKRRAYLHEILQHSKNNDCGNKGSRVKLHELFRTLPYLLPSSEFMDNILNKIK